MTLIILTEIWNWATWSCSLLGKATGCLLMTRLESAPGVTWGPRVPKCTALCAETLPPPQHTLLLMCSLALESQEAGGERQWRLVRIPCQGEWKEKKNHLLLNQWCPTVQPHTLSLFTFVLKVAQRTQLSAFFITAHILPSPLPETCCLFYPPLAQTPFSPLQLHPLPNRCSVAKLQSTYVTFFN